MAIDSENLKVMTTAVQEAINRHGVTNDALIPVLSDVNDRLGYLPDDALAAIGQALQVPPSRVLSTASFYRMLSTQPRGKHVIKFCESAPCHVMGGREVWEALQEQLGLGPGQTSADGQWTLLATSCPGVCGVGPVMDIDGDIYGNLTPDRLHEILAQYE